MYESRDIVHVLTVDAVAPRLRQFAVLAQEQNVTRAAAILGLAQSTLSRNIARIEADLGLTLFMRTGRAIALTRFGRQLLPYTERAIAELSAGLEELSDELDPGRGRVAFAFLQSLGPQAVPALLRDFRATHPGVRFTLVQDGHQAMLDKLSAGTVDLCITSPMPDVPGVRARKLDEQRLSLVVPAGHPLAGRRQIRLVEAASEEYVGFEHGYGLRSITDDWCRQAGFVPRMAFEGQDIDTLLGLVSTGLGVALLPAGASTTGGGQPKGYDVAELRVTEPPTTRPIALVWLADRVFPPAVDAFRASVLGYRGRLLGLTPKRSRAARPTT
jgi:DNA-binding transcriptional LysR family regulator